MCKSFCGCYRFSIAADTTQAAEKVLSHRLGVMSSQF